MTKCVEHEVLHAAGSLGARLSDAGVARGSVVDNLTSHSSSCVVPLCPRCCSDQ